MWTYAGVFLLATCACAITRDQFYTYGSGLDQRLPRGNQVSSPEIPLKVPIVFYGETYETVFVNNFGIISFRADIPSFLNAEFPLPYPSIAAFYTNVDTSESGAVYYRETDESHVLSKAEESVQDNFHDYYDFKPTSVFIATWLDVTFKSTDIQKQTNSFQIAVISNGTESFVELLYPDREIQWIQREPEELSLPDAKAQVGFVSEDGRVYTIRNSGSDQVRNVVAWSNTQQPGKYVFRVGNIPLEGEIAIPDQYNQTDFDFEEESKTCAQSGPSLCHTRARCVDYEAGICCQCNEGFYGNGKSCVKDDVPLRVHGKLNGRINGVNLEDVDIQAYVVVSDGRSYTALTQVPPIIGNTLLFLTVLDTTIGWLFAKTIGGAKNGYQLTGSLFNHTANIYFPGTNNLVTINQEYLGHDVFDQITIRVFVEGTLPPLLNDTKLDISEFQEQYTIDEPGLVHSQSTRKFKDRRTSQEYEQTVSQSFTYSPCRFAPFSQEDKKQTTLIITKNYLGYEIAENIVRYGTSNKVTPIGLENPCTGGQNTCGPHSTCVVQDDTFTCECQSGYSDIYIEDTIACIDIDECAAGSHNCDVNADCLNEDGGFQCECRNGFEGDGFSCQAPSPCKDKNCNANAQCTLNYLGDPTCVCNAGYTGNGIQCWPVIPCNNACSPDASCVISENTRSYECRCHAGYSGDGYYCTEDQRTTTPTIYTETESLYNETFVLPHCDSISCVCPTGYTRFREFNNELCRIDSYVPATEKSDGYDSSLRCSHDGDCPPNAICTSPSNDSSEESRHCVCPEGYEGDAYECIERTGYTCRCGPYSHCVATPNGQYLCMCNSGYRGDGYECSPIFTCTNDSDCEYNAGCTFDVNSNAYICQCIEGYVKDQNDACIPGQLCNGAQCVQYATCLYDAEIDVHYCHCDDGYDGDGVTQCSPAQRFETCNELNDCSIDAICTPVESTYQCQCREGYIGDGYTCTLEENCRTIPNWCDSHASCLKRGDAYECVCNSGYNGNGSVCQLNPRQNGNFLVVSDGASVYRVPFHTNTRQYPTPINSAIYQTAVGVDVDCERGTIYWGDVIGNSIKSAAYDGSGFNYFLPNDVKAPEGISVDWTARNIFWTDSKKYTIEVANIDTKVRKVLFSGNGITNPRGIAVHPEKGKVFWSDWNRLGAKIEWANMDGSQRGVFLDQSDVKLPNSLAIDWSRDRLCYADAGLSAIKCVGIDTLERVTIATNCTYPFGLAISGNKFYWTDWRTLQIEYIDITTQIKGRVETSKPTRLYGLAVAPDACPPGSNVCQYRNGQCLPNELCLPNGQGSRTCVTGDGFYEENQII
ncbi:nidogen-like [Achroia grisella]|uniref:nidogen-like n=1 Tax=Achroia grisella TaxID=688607 RepID=UPI0027D3355E|nr:nidogen-like [Achroia grisella]